jgi:hypothetical protein
MAEGIVRFAERRSDLLRVDPRKLKWEPGFGGRDFETPENKAHIESLKASIMVVGVLNPIAVWHDKIADALIPVDGECRLRAVMLAIEDGADIKTIPAIPIARASNAADRIVEQLTRNTGKRYGPLEMAGMVKKLEAFGWKRQEIANKLGMSAQNVANLLDGAAMPEAAQELVRSGEVSFTAARKTIEAEGPTEGVATLQQAVEEKREAEPAPPLSNDLKAPKKVKAEKIREVAERRKGTPSAQRETRPKPTDRQNMSSLYDALFNRINKFLTRCQDGSFEDEENSVPTKLAGEATELASLILQSRRGFKEQEAEAAE